MKKTPMEIVLHTKRIPFSDFGSISMLGEILKTPLHRCKYCNIVPNVHYYNWNSVYTIEHRCKAYDIPLIHLQANSYEELAELWNGRN